MNLALLAKWAWKFNLSTTNPRWNQVIAACYSRRQPGMRVVKNLSRLSLVWEDISKHLGAFWNCLSFKLGDGSSIHFSGRCFWAGRYLLLIFLMIFFSWSLERNYAMRSQWSLRFSFWRIQQVCWVLFTKWSNLMTFADFFQHLGPLELQILHRGNSPKLVSTHEAGSFYKLNNNGVLICPYNKTIWKAGIP